MRLASRLLSCGISITFYYDIMQLEILCYEIYRVFRANTLHGTDTYMTLAITDSPSETMASVIGRSSLENKVRHAIASHTEFDLDRIHTQDNREKYAGTLPQQAREQDAASEGTEHLDEVFQLMRQLNAIGIGSPTLGRISEAGRSFRDALRTSCEQVAEAVRGDSLTYVELGPEPVKTGFILKTLLALGVRVERYIAVDINPKSAAHMRNALEPLLPGLPLDFVVQPFEAFRLADHTGTGSPHALITMLGFQEGNDDPHTVGDWLSDIARPGDLMLSESQLYAPGTLAGISGFYAHPAMQRFSRIAFERAFGAGLPTLNRFFLLPVFFQDGHTAQVAILAEEYTCPTTGRNLHVSNFCLKLTLEQYRLYRQQSGCFEIAGETFTDDETLHFQLSRRV